jgi:hypothetical protein
VPSKTPLGGNVRVSGYRRTGEKPSKKEKPPFWNQSRVLAVIALRQAQDKLNDVAFSIFHLPYSIVKLNCNDWRVE